MEIIESFIANVLVLCGLAIAVLALAPGYLEVIAEKKVERIWLGLLNYIFFVPFSVIVIGAFYLVKNDDYQHIILIGAPLVCITAVFIVVFLCYRSYSIR